MGFSGSLLTQKERRPWREAKRRFLSCAVFFAAFILAGPLWAKPNNVAKTPPAKQEKNEPSLIQADEISYDQNTGIVTATGHVEIAQALQVLHADIVVYDKIMDTVHAAGHVALLQPDGNVLFGRQMTLTRDMKQGFIEKVGMLFVDDSRLAAEAAERYEGRYLIGHHGVYTACKLCATDPTAPPLWQIKGVRITHDNVAKRVIYRDAVVEFAGVPLFYTPYFAHPDPTVKRQQGFLTPYGGVSPNLGAMARTPYYFDFAPNSDATITPTFSANDKIQLENEWRYRFDKGRMQWDGSFTRADLVNDKNIDVGQQWRGHLFGSTAFSLNNVWRAGTDIAFTSDKTYFQRYNIKVPVGLSSDVSDITNVLVNRGYVEGFEGRHYAVSNLYYFQDIRPGTQMSEPYVLPETHFSALGEPGKTFGGRWSMDGGLLITTRNEDVNKAYQGPNTRRLAFDAGWNRSFVSSTGLLADISALTRLDGYSAENVPNPTLPAGASFTNTTMLRPFAQTTATVRYPLGRRGADYEQTLEPISVLSIAPRVGLNPKLPNEDSQDVNFDTTNLFAPNHYTGIDRMDGGTSVAYGVRNSLAGDNGVRLEMLGGQLYRFTPNNDFPMGSGLNTSFSDFVGRFDLWASRWFNMGYGIRVDSSSLGFQREEIQASGGVPEFRPNINYVLNKGLASATNPTGPVEEATFGFGSLIATYWSFTAAQVLAFQPNPGPRSTTFALNYKDECFLAGVTYSRNDLQVGGLNKGDTLMFHFNLKNVGGFQQSL